MDESDEAVWYARTASLTSPCREEQMAVLLGLVPFDDDEAFKAVDVGCGDGRLTQCLLSTFGRVAEVVGN